MLTHAGYEVYLSDTELAGKVLRQAGVAFFTNILNDFGMHSYLNEQRFASLDTVHKVGYIRAASVDLQ